MTKFDFAEIHISKRAHFAVQAPTMISQDDARPEPYGLPGALCSRIRACGRDLRGYTCFHLFRFVLRVRLMNCTPAVRRGN